MPFTISHAALVLPWSRMLLRWGVLSAVIIGAMVPDFGLFFPWHMHRFETHSAVALVTFCLPVGLATYWLFQYLIKAPLVELLPEGPYARWCGRVSPADFSDIPRWLMAAGGVLAGAVTHLVWDAFTHENARGIRMIPWLEEPAVEIGMHRMAGVRLMQDGSSLIGLLIVVLLTGYALRRGRETPVLGRALPPAERWIWVLASVIAAVGLSTVWFLWARVGEPRGHSIKALATGIAVAGLRGIALALLCASLALRWRVRALRQRAPRRSP